MNFKSSKFQLHFLPQYTLIVKVDYQYDHLLIINDHLEVMRYISYSKVEPEEEALKLLSLPFEKVFLLLGTQSKLVLPYDTYDPSLKGVYQKFLLKESTDSQFACKLKDYGVVVCYELDEWLLDGWNKIYADIEVVPEFQIIFQLIKEHINKGLVLNIHMYDKKIDFYLFKEGRITLINTFEIHTPEDLRFYLLQLLKFSEAEETVFDKVLVTQDLNRFDIKAVMGPYCRELIYVKGNLHMEEDQAVLAEVLNKMNFAVKEKVCEL